VFGELTELTVEGGLAVGSAGAPQPLVLHNLRCRNGPVVLTAAATQALVVSDSRFDGCSVVSLGSGPVTATGCCFVGGTITGLGPAPLQLTGCHAPNPGANVQVSQPLQAPQLGSMAIVPEDVAVGGTVQFVADLPPGLIGLFALGFTDPTPTLLGAPFQVYFDPASYVVLPGAYVLQQAFAWTVPNSASFVGFDLMAHLVVLPGAGVQAPWLQLPPGRRFVLQ
jgi:hypothetical protein